MNINWKNIETKIIINNKNSDAKNILFLHGFGGNYNNKLSFYNFFNQYNYYCINMVGHGNSLIENKMSGELLSRTTLDANTLALNFAFAMGNVFTMPTIVICTLIAMFIISPYLTLLSLVFIQFCGPL